MTGSRSPKADRAVAVVYQLDDYRREKRSRALFYAIAIGFCVPFWIGVVVIVKWIASIIPT
jgi:hypothetical protein